MDSLTKKVAIAPIVEDDDEEFPGREYLGIYPYIQIGEGHPFAYQFDGKFKSIEAWVRNTYDWLGPIS